MSLVQLPARVRLPMIPAEFLVRAGVGGKKIPSSRPVHIGDMREVEKPVHSITPQEVTKLDMGDIFISDGPEIARGDRDSTGRVTVGYAEYSCRSLKADDESRRGAPYLVIDSNVEGGGEGMFHDRYSDGLHILASRLNSDGSLFGEDGMIQFYMTGAFTCMLTQVTLVGRVDFSPGV